MRTHFGEQGLCLSDSAMADISRRTAIAAIACAQTAVLCAASSLPVSPADPVFAAIAAYDRAAAAHEAENAHHDAVFVQGKPSWAQIKELDRLGYEAFDREQSALENVVRTSPTTVGGLAAWSQFLIEHMGRLADQGDEQVVFSGTVMDLLSAVRRFAVGAG